MATQYQLQNRAQPILGLIKNVSAERLDRRAWLTMTNMCIRAGQLQKCGGWVARKTAAGIPVQVAGSASLVAPLIFTGAGQSALIATTSGLYQLDPSTNLVTALNLGDTPFESAPDQRWRADYLLGRWYFTNQTDGLWMWSGAGAPVKLNIQTNGANGADVAQFFSHILVANLFTEDGTGAHQLAGSSLPAADGTVNWAEDPNSDTDLVDIPDAGTAILAMLRLGQWLAIYKELSSIHLASYIGAPNIYQIQTVDTMRGPVAGPSVIDIGGTHLYVGRDNLYSFSGSPPTPWGDRVWDWWRNAVAVAGWRNIYAFRDPRNREVFFIYNAGSSAGYTSALVWNQEFDTFAIRDFPFRAVGLVRRPDTTIPTFDQLPQPMDSIGILSEPSVAQSFDPVGIMEDGTAYTLTDDVSTTNGANLTATLESGDDCCENEAKMKVFGGLYLDVPVLTGTPLQVYVCARKSLGDPLIWKGPYNYKRGGRLDFMVQGRWVRFKFVKTDGQFVLRGYAPLYQLRGER